MNEELNDGQKKFRNKFIFILIATVLFMGLLVGFASAEIVIKQNVASDIKRACFNNGFFCSSAFVCNLTITQADGTIILNNGRMSYNPSFYNYTLTFSNTGNYNAFMSCNNVTNAGEDTFDITVNTSGTISTNSKTWSSIFGAVFLFLAGIGLAYLSINLFSFMPLRYSAGILSALIFFSAFNIVIALMRDDLSSPAVIDFFDKFSAMSLWVYWFGIGLILVVWIMTLLVNTLSAGQKKKNERLMGL